MSPSSSILQLKTPGCEQNKQAEDNSGRGKEDGFPGTRVNEGTAPRRGPRFSGCGSLRPEPQQARGTTAPGRSLVPGRLQPGKRGPRGGKPVSVPTPCWPNTSGKTAGASGFFTVPQGGVQG